MQRWLWLFAGISRHNGAMTTPMLVGGALLGLVILVIAVRLLRPRKPKPWIQTAVCPSCGWRGQTSRHAGRCPSCNTPIGEQRARQAGQP